jgi:hypothetical protein
MKGFLVVGRCVVDDVPLLFTNSLDTARQYAELPADVMRGIIKRVARDLRCFNSRPSCTAIIHFEDGQPVRCDHCVKALDL